MKNLILFFLIIISANVKAQTLKELLFSGKLKTDSNTVIRKTDDYRSKVDTATKRNVAESKAGAVDTIAIIPAVAKANQPVVQNAPTAAPAVPVTTKEVEKPNEVVPVAAPAEVKAPVKSNSKIWKDYSEALVNSLKTEVLPNKKIKKNNYYFTVEYVIEPDGKATIGNISSDPDNAVLTAEVKNRITNEPPQFTPVLDSNNKGIKVKKRSSFFITKE